MTRPAIAARPGTVPLLLGIVLLLLLAEPLRAQQPVGSVDALAGQAFARGHGATNERALAVGSELFEGDRVRTAPESRARLLFVDQTAVQLGESTELTLDWFLHAPELETRSVLLSVPAGFIRVIVDALVSRSQLELHTNTAVAAVRGTDWIAEATADSTAIVTLEGVVAVRNVAPRVAGQVTLRAGDGTTVNAGEPPTEPTQWGAARRTTFIEATTVP